MLFSILVSLILFILKPVELSPQCANISIDARSDCYPERDASSDKCLSRGCCWIVVTHITKNVPACFFPTNYPAYKVQSVEQFENGFIAQLTKSQLSYNPKSEFGQIQAEIRYESTSRLRFRITIPSEPNRWEPPIPLNKPDLKFDDKLQYTVALSKSPFGLKISRSDNVNHVLLDSTNQMAANLIISDQFLQLSFRLPSAKIGFGIGEVESSFPLPLNEWKRVGLWAHDGPPRPNVNLYGVHNFFMAMDSNGQAFGIFFFNSNAQDVALSPLPSLTYRTLGGIMDFFIFIGPKPADVIRQYYELIGKPPIPPYWSLGFHLCRYGLKTLNDTRNIFRRNIEANIPIDAHWFDIDYMDAYKVWSVDGKNYAGVEDYVEKELHKKYSMRSVIILDPAISTKGDSNYAPFVDGLKWDVFIKDNRTGKPILGKVWPGETVFPDFSHPHAFEWWSKLAQNFRNLHIKFDGLWIDMNEPASFVHGSLTGCLAQNTFDNPPFVPSILGNSLYDKTVCPSAMHHDTSHYNRHNLYAYDQARVTYQSLQHLFPNKRPFLLTRSTFAGSGQYAIHWTGDVPSTWQSMKATIAQMINFNMFAMPMIGADICGFIGNVDEELCIRWSQLGAFYPFSRNHNDDVSRHQDPASWSPNAVDAIRKAIEMRYYLLPYLYSLFFRSHFNGTTVVRALAFEYPSDPNTYNIDSQLMLGSCLLITPVLNAGQTNVSGYVPLGEWIEFSSGRRIQSRGQQMTFSAPLSVIPVLGRGGCIVPLQYKVAQTTIARKQGMGLVVFLRTTDNGRLQAPIDGIQAEGELFWDDGESANFTEHVHIHFVVVNRQLRIYSSQLSQHIAKTHLDLKELQLKFVLIVGLAKSPSQVAVNKQPMKFKYYSQHNILSLKWNQYLLLTDNMYIEWSF